MDGEFRCYEWQGEPALLNQRVCRLRGFDKSLESRFLFYGINKFLKDIEDVTGYTTVKHLSSKSILAIEMPVPPLDEQKRIVARLDVMKLKTSEMVAAYDAKLAAAKNLRQSVLESAFAGDL
jgi:type I restriction enzyme S subunit